jgi:predicted RND superfamily exporter protein
MQQLVKLIFKHKKLILIFTGLLTLFFGYGLTKIKINSDIIGYLPKDDPAVVLFNQVGDTFSGNDLALVAVESEDVFSAGTVAGIKKITEAFKGLDGISAVTSITNILDIRKTADNSVEVGKLLDPDNLPATAADYQKVREYALSKELYRGRLVSQDGKTTLIVCRLAPNVDKTAVTRSIKKAALAAQVPEKLYFGGVPFVTLELADAIFNDLKSLIPLVCILVIITLYWSFRTVRGVLVPLVSVGISTIWTLGFMSWVKVPLSIISDVIPVLLIAVGTAPCIHILSKYDEKVSRYGSDGAEVQGAFGEVGLRVILTELTIVLGFTSFIFGSYLTMIREFGIFTALGTVFVMVVATLAVPAALSYMHVKAKPGQVQMRNEDTVKPVSGFMHVFSQFILKNEVGIVVAWLLVFVVMALGTMKIERKVNFIEFFKPQKPIRLSDNILAQRFGGAEPLQVRVIGDMQNPGVLKEMHRLTRYMESVDQLNNAQSVSGLVAEVDDAMNNEKIVPDTRDKVVNLWFFLDGQEILPQMVSSDLSQGLVQAMIATRDSRAVKPILDNLGKYLESVPQGMFTVPAALVPAEGRPVLAAWRANRAADMVAWDIQKYFHGLNLDKATLVKNITAALEAAGKNPRQPGRVEAPALLSSLLPLLPENVRADLRWQESATNDLRELNDAVVYVAEDVYRKLGLANLPRPERIALKMDYCGMPLISQHLDQSIVDSQVQSFILALIFIFALLALQLRSLVGGLIGLLPIVLTVFITFGFMGYAHVPLDVATVLVASIALGIGIDYAIHVCIRFKHYFEISSDLGTALENTMHTTGKAILINVVSVTMGFLTLMAADLIPLQRFGLLVSITMIFSGLASVTLLPSLIILTRAGFIGSWDRLHGKIKKHVNNLKEVRRNKRGK